jgi:hypothetical protein
MVAGKTKQLSGNLKVFQLKLFMSCHQVSGENQAGVT